MAKEFRLPDLGEGIHEGEIIDVLVKEGEDVKEDQSILEVETDKAAVELPSPFTGNVTRIYVKKGDLVHVGDLLVSFDGEAEVPLEVKQEEEKPEPTPQKKTAAPQPAPQARPQAQPQTEKQPPAARGSGPVPAAPSTRRLARELGVDLRLISGSGPAGRVLAGDVHAFAESGGQAVSPETQAAAQTAVEESGRALEAPLFSSGLQAPDLPDFSQWGAVEKQPLRSVRRATARQMSLSWAHIPHVNHHEQVDITALDETRRVYNSRFGEEEQAGRLTLTVFVIKALAAALRKTPRFNASLDEKAGEIVLKKYINIGVAVDTPRGLIVPVIRMWTARVWPSSPLNWPGWCTRPRPVRRPSKTCRVGPLRSPTPARWEALPLHRSLTILKQLSWEWAGRAGSLWCRVRAVMPPSCPVLSCRWCWLLITV